MISLADLAKATGALAAVGAAGLAYAGVIECNWFALREAQVPVLPRGARPIRILAFESSAGMFPLIMPA